MAKKAAKETSLPLVFALVFFVLTTIAFGVMWYMQLQETASKEEAAKKAGTDKTNEAGLRADAELKGKIYRIYLGIPEDNDVSDVKTATTKQTLVTTEVKKVQDALTKQVSNVDGGKLPDDFPVWKLDDKGEAKDPPTTGVLSTVSKTIKERDEARKQADLVMKDYNAAIANSKKSSGDYETATKDFQALAKLLPEKFAADLKKEHENFDARTRKYSESEQLSRDANEKLEAEKNKAERERKKLEGQVADLTKDSIERSAREITKRDAFQFDEPQGKIKRRLPEGIVEINLGSNALVQPGLTFTVLPYDFPEKGRQSRIRNFRVPNERGEYKDVARFVEKATIEVIEVLGPDLSRARITSEQDYIRDGASPGDLLYNAVWRKGQADHIALVGVFDINGDGTDDIETVVRDLSRMGVIVDAYFDLKQRKWVGQVRADGQEGRVSEQTRYIIKGRFPVQAANDPNREAKTQLIDAMSKAIQSGREKGIQDVDYRDFFPRMGYRIKIDVADDKVNQATAPYLKGVTSPDAPPPGEK